MVSPFFCITLITAFSSALASGNIQLWPDEPDYGVPVATIPLLSNVAFLNSFNSPQGVTYNPPNVDFNRVSLELLVNTTSSNYDRLGMAFFNGIEIWRTSTSEPANDNAHWDYSKDVSEYLSLFKQTGRFEFLINNIVNEQFQGTFQVSITANFYKSSNKPSTDDSWAIALDNPATNIQTFRKNPTNLYWTAPSDDIEISVPQQASNVNRALLQVFASGNSNDEFWWNTHGGSGPSRFVNAYINGQPAGYAAPFPIIYTGGINAELWKPLVGIRAYDVPSYFMDVTAFLPKLWSGASTLKLNISNGIDNNPVPSNWIVNVNLFTWSTPGQTNSGTMDNPQDTVNTLDNSLGPSPQHVLLTRSYSSSATLTIGGTTQKVGWNQKATFENHLTINADDTTIFQKFTGTDSVIGTNGVSRTFNYPLTVEIGPTKNHVQESYSVQSPVSLYTWIDTNVNLDGNGKVTDTQSSQYLEEASVSHFKKAVNGQIVETW